MNRLDDVYLGAQAVGRFRNASVPPGGRGAHIRLYDFTTISVDSGVSVEAFGAYPLGLMAIEDIEIKANSPFGGKDGTPGEDGSGDVGGGGGAGGGGGGAVIIASNSGSIALAGTLDVSGGAAGPSGASNLPGASANFSTSL